MRVMTLSTLVWTRLAGGLSAQTVWCWGAPAQAFTFRAGALFCVQGQTQELRREEATGSTLTPHLPAIDTEHTSMP